MLVLTRTIASWLMLCEWQSLLFSAKTGEAMNASWAMFRILRDEQIFLIDFAYVSHSILPRILVYN